MDDLMVFRAKCCNPIRGEKIVGYITRGKGVSVHSASCPNVVNLLFDPERRIDVEWDTGQDPVPYTVRLRISVEDRRGILADVSSRIADIDTNIKDIEATVGVDQRGSIRMTRRDQRSQASRAGDEIDPECGRRAGGRAGWKKRVLTAGVGTSQRPRSHRSPPAHRAEGPQPGSSHAPARARRSTIRTRHSLPGSRPCRPDRPSS